MPTFNVYALVPHEEQYNDVFEAIAQAAILGGSRDDVQVSVARRGRRPDPNSPTYLLADIESASLVVADTSGAEPEIMRELGLAQAFGKPLILIHQDDDLIPSFLSEQRTLLYDRSRLYADLVPRLGTAIAEVLGGLLTGISPERPADNRDAKRVFVSYSHADREALDRLLVHLKPLHKNGTLDVWADAEIKAGDRWEEEIENAYRGPRSQSY